MRKSVKDYGKVILIDLSPIYIWVLSYFVVDMPVLSFMIKCIAVLLALMIWGTFSMIVFLDWFLKWENDEKDKKKWSRKVK